MIKAGRDLLFIVLTFFTLSAGAQTDNTLIDTELWPAIESRLNQPGQNGDFEFILPMAASFSRKHNIDLNETYDRIRFKLERLFNLPAAIYLTEEMVKLARKQKNKQNEADAYKNLYRFYDAIGLPQLALKNINNAEEIFQQLNSKSSLIYTRFIKLNHQFRFSGKGDLFAEIKKLLREAEISGDSSLLKKLRVNTIEIAIAEKAFDFAETLISGLEKTPVSTPIKQTEYPYLIVAARGRGNIETAKNNKAGAIKNYLEALHYCKLEPSRWEEISILNKLAEIEWAAGNSGTAQKYLYQARANAEKLGINELLMHTYGLKATIAEKEHRFEEALAFTKKKLEQEEIIKAKNKGFSPESFYLKLENDKLAAEKKIDELEIKAKKSQLSKTLITSALLCLLLTGLTIGFIKLRRGKSKLAMQNMLIQQQAGKLKDLDDAKSRFFANISHELRTPLSLILGSIKMLLKDNQISEKQVSILATASRNTEHLNELINEILDLGKLEMGKMTLQKEPVNLNSFFQVHVCQFESQAKQKKINFEHHINIGKNITAAIDKEKCRQVINNMLSNAFKFTSPGGRIAATVVVKDHELQLEVADTGPGIHPDDLPYIFNRFFQTSQKEKPIAGGMGIGLALCHEYAQLFGGSIRAESTLGEGATLFFSFPVSCEEVEDIIPGTGQYEAPANYGITEILPSAGDEQVATDTGDTILVVEDNFELQQYIRLILSDRYRVVTAENGQAALDVMSDGVNAIRPDLILSDLMMPLMDGYQLLEKLKGDEKTRPIPVIMLTARADAADRLKALRFGVDDYLIKPFEEEELQVRIDALLKNQAIRKAEALKPPSETDALPFIPAADKEWLENFENYIQKNIANSQMGVYALSLEFAMSESTLLRQVRRLTGLNPNKYLQEMRLNEARHLLEHREVTSIARVASMVGYNDYRSFSRSYKNRFGKLPTGTD